MFQVFPQKKNKLKTTSTGVPAFESVADVDNMSCRVAPGMEISYVVRFSPETKTDY